ncbi:MAG: 3-hydroxyacyl-CoA dehydrogenase [Pseudomonadota bacterium]
MKAPDAADYRLGVAGAGAMGQGIAQVAAAGGVEVLLLDARAGAAAAACETIRARLARLVEKGRMGAAEAEAAAVRLTAVDTVAALAPCDTVVEAVFEDLAVKRRLFAEVEAVVSDTCIVASNTSSIPIAQIAAGCRLPGRVAGLHFFNPVPLMKLVEVISATATGPGVVETLVALGRRLTRVPVVVKDSPGFLVNMGGRAFTTEGMRLVHEGVATPAQIDAIMRDCWGFRMGPFELMDLTGIDVNYPVSQIVWEGYQQDPRLATRPIHKAMFDAGLLGRKTSAGWYRYEGGKPVDVPSPDHVPDCAPARRVALAEAAAPETMLQQLSPEDAAALRAADAPLAPALEAFCAELGLEIVEDDGTCPIVSADPTRDATETAVEGALDHRRLVCVDLTGDATRRVTVMTPPGADLAYRDAVAAAVVASGRQVSAIRDSVGFVGPRMAAMVANLGCYIAEIGLATPADIDTAMELGLSYPRGPLKLADAIGGETCLHLLEGLQHATGEDRYRPTQWLRRRALLDLPMDTPA